MSTLLCRLTSIILKIEAPRCAAEVRNPARSECPLNSSAFSPTRRALALTISATARSEGRRLRARPALLIGRNYWTTDDFGRLDPVPRRLDRARERAGHDGDRRALPLLIGLAQTYSYPQSTVAELQIAYIESHKFGAAEGAREAEEQQRAIARSPLGPVPELVAMATISSDVAGTFWFGTLCSFRLMPRSVSLTASDAVGEGCPAGQAVGEADGA